MSATYPTQKMSEQKIPTSKMHKGAIVESNIEGGQEPKETIRTNTRK